MEIPNFDRLPLVNQCKAQDEHNQEQVERVWGKAAISKDVKLHHIDMTMPDLPAGTDLRQVLQRLPTGASVLKHSNLFIVQLPKTIPRHYALWQGLAVAACLFLMFLIVWG